MLRSPCLGIGLAAWAAAAVVAGCDDSPLILQINEDAGFLVVARHVTVQSVGTEQIQETLGYEVVTSAAGGLIRLHPPRVVVGEPASFVVLSKPGYQIFSGPADGLNMAGPTQRDGERIELRATTCYREERLAGLHLERGVAGLRNACETDGGDDDVCRSLWNHLDARQAFLDTTYPFAHDPLLAGQPRPLSAGRVLISGWGKMRQQPEAELLAAVARPGGGLAVLETTPEQAALVLLDAQQAVAATLELPEAGAALALSRSPTGTIELLAGDAILRFGPGSERVGEIALQPPPGLGDVVVSLASRPAGGWVIGVRRPDASVARIYDGDGRLIDARLLGGIRRLDRVWLAPDRALVALGDLEGAYRNDLEIAGRHKQGMPRGLVRYGIELGGTLLLDGVDSAGFTADGGWAWVTGLADAADHAAAQEGDPSLDPASTLRQALLRLSWAGEVEETIEVADPEVGQLQADLVDVTPEGRLLLRARGDSVGLGADLFELAPHGT